MGAHRPDALPLGDMKAKPLLTRLRASGCRRASTGLLAFAFLLIASGQALGRYHCPHHDGAVAASADGHSSEAGEHGDHAGPTSAPDTHHPGDESSPCRCIGTCHGSAAAPLPGAVVWLASSGPVRSVESERPHRSRLVALVPHVLPFPNGPPGLV